MREYMHGIKEEQQEFKRQMNMLQKKNKEESKKLKESEESKEESEDKEGKSNIMDVKENEKNGVVREIEKNLRNEGDTPKNEENYDKKGKETDNKTKNNDENNNKSKANNDKEEYKDFKIKDEKEEKINELKNQIDDFLTAKRLKALMEIFNFYSKQHIGGGPKSTFEDIHNNSTSLNLGEFMKFCTDFKFPIEKYIQK